MRNKILLSCLIIFTFQVFTVAQKITRKFENKSIEDILTILIEEKQANIAFDEALPDMKKKVSKQFNNQEVAAVLKSLFENTKLDFKKVGEIYVVFSKKDGSSTSNNSTNLSSYTISGIVKDKKSGESLPGAYIVTIDNAFGGVSNDYGFYSLTLPGGDFQFMTSYLGYQSSNFSIDLNKNMNYDIELEEDGILLADVVISEQKMKVSESVTSLQMSKLSVPMSLIAKTPTILGENDIIKVFQLMPGVKRGGEGGTAMYVRGGSSDENLVLLDEAPVYNAGHLIGILSVFNSSAIKKADFYKGNADASYGGRLSSVLDIKMKEGNNKKFAADASISNIASSLTIEAPIIKDKSSFIISGRRFYLDKIIDVFSNGLFPYHFYDLNAKLNYSLDKNNRLYLSSYLGKDELDLASSIEQGLELIDTLNNENKPEGDFGSVQGNITNTLRWNKQYKNQKIFHNLTVYTSRFKYEIKADAISNSLFINSSINDYGLKFSINNQINPKLKLDYGAQLVHHTFRPAIFTSLNDSLSENLIKSINIFNGEYGLYGSVNREFDKDFACSFGLRLSGLIAKSKTYANLEPRFTFRKGLADHHSIKGAYSRNAQYVHLIQSSSVSLPSDLWYPITKNVPPGISDQISLGYFTNIGPQRDIQISVEGYRKWMKNLIEYKEGAVLLFQSDIEDQLLIGKGDAYGAEIMIQKNTGRISGWIGYTYSHATRQFDDINNGKKYFSKYDKRHDLSVVASLELTKKFDLNFVYVYSTGSPFTPIVGRYLLPTPGLNGIDIIPIYAERNSHRLNNSSRFDVDLVFKSLRQPKFEFHIGAYNLLNKVQPTRVAIDLDKTTGELKYREKGIIGLIVSIGFKFKINQ